MTGLTGELVPVMTGHPVTTGTSSPVKTGTGAPLDICIIQQFQLEIIREHSILCKTSYYNTHNLKSLNSYAFFRRDIFYVKCH